MQLLQRILCCGAFATLTVMPCAAQHSVSLALSNTGNALLFGKLTTLISGPYHPGIEAGYWLRKAQGKNGGWVFSGRTGYMYHRFVQHGISLYFTAGYERRISDQWSAAASIGGGYFHSFSDAGVYRLQQDGSYARSGSSGRPQAMVAAELKVAYSLPAAGKHGWSVFAQYQQRLQLPFNKTYVPVLPANVLQIGAQMTLPEKKKKITGVQ